MKTPINPITPKSGPISRLTLLAAALIVPATTGLAQTMWTDGTADYNIPANWNGTYMDGSDDTTPNPNCDNDTGSNNVILIQPGDPAWYHGDTLAGQGTGTSGAYLQTGSTNNTGYPNNGNWLRMGIGSGTYGSYILSNGVVNVAGQTHMGESGTGYLEIDGGVYNTGFNGDPGICAGDGDFGPGTGTLVMTGGIVTNHQETWFGEENGAGVGTGYFKMTGGTFNADNWFVFGRNGATGYGVMTGGTINFTGGGEFLIGGGGIGSLFQSGGTINVYNQYLIPQSGSSTDVGTNILSGTAVLNVHDWLAVGRDSGYGELDVSNGAAITRDNADGDTGGNFTVGSSGRGILNQNGGAITNLAGNTYIGESGTGFWNLNSGIASLGTVVMGLDNGSSGTLTLNGGTLQVFQIGAGTGGSEINFNGSMLQATGNNANFLSGITETYISSGGVTVDSQNYNITIAEELDDNGGGLTKIGSGTLTLSNPNNQYSGDTVVGAGNLIVETGSQANGNYVVADNATLEVSVQSANGQLNQSSLALGSSTGATLNFDLGGFGNPSSAALNVGGPVTVNGTITININDGFSQVGQFPLIQFPNGDLTGSGHFVLGSIPTGVTANLVVTSTSVSLDITAVTLPVWQGLAGGTWDLSGTTNWINQGSGLPIAYADGDAVQFNDTAPGTTNVTLTTTVSPGNITVNNNNLNYTFLGSGSISGSTGLTKEGTNTLAILNPSGNTYTGITVIDGGRLSVTNLANGGSASAIGASSAGPTNLVLAGGALRYSGPPVSINRGYIAENTNGTVDLITVSNLTLSGTVLASQGSGFTKSGPAQLGYTSSGIDTLSDVLGYQVNAGTVMFGGSGTDYVSGNLNVAVSNNVSATIAVTNSVTLNLVGSGTFDIADTLGLSNTNYAVVNQSGGTVNVGQNYSTFIGQNSNSVGVYNISGGTFNFNNWLAVGRDNGVGTINLSGTGALNMISGNGGNIDIGNSGGINGQLGTGVLNQSGGSVSNVVSGTWLGEGTGAGPSGTWNMTGGIAWIGYLGVGYNGTGTGQLSISGNASITVYNSNAIELGRTAGSTGTLTIGSTNGSSTGSLTQIGSADFNVGNSGNGVLNMLSGGALTLGAQTTMYLTRGSASSGYVYLNSGSKIITGYLNNGWGFTEKFTTNAAAFYFNGGTLQAATGSPYFIQPYVNAIIETNGAFIDDGGFNITALCTFVDAAGSSAGLTKLDSGTLILAATNTYTGPTVVSAGTLQANVLYSPVTVDSGATLLTANIINGAVTVNSGGTLGGNVGIIGTVTVNGNLSLASGSTTFLQLTPASNDQIAGLTGVSYGGSLIVSNISSSALTVGSQFKLFNSAMTGTGNFSTVTVLPIGTGTFNPASGILTITSSGVLQFNPTSVSNGNLVVTGTGGTPGSAYSLLTATNLLTPLADWTTNISGVFSSTGTFSNGVPINATNPAQFFMLKTP